MERNFGYLGFCLVRNGFRNVIKLQNRMKLNRLLPLLIVLLSMVYAKAQHDGFTNKISTKAFNPSTVSWYNAPAKKWDEALPVGNGRLGAMVFGRSGEERIQLNEETYWSGGPYSTVVKGGYKVLPEIQKLVFDEKYLAAHNLFGRNLMGYPVEQ